MPEIKVALLKGDRIATDVQYRDNLPVNMYAIMRPIWDVVGYMASHPGYQQFGDDVVGSDRGGNWNERLEQHLRVSGEALIRVDQNGDVVNLGTISGDDQASLPYSFNTQAIIADLRMWLYDGATLTEVTDVDLGNPIDGCWIDGYYFLTDGEFLYHTELVDEFAINPIKFATSEFSPDPTVAVAKTQDNQVMVFNRYTTEFFRDAGNEGFVFERIQGKATKAGIIGTHLKIEMGGEFYTLGSSKEEAPTFLIIGAGKATNFSTRSIDNILRTYTEQELALGVMDTRTDDRDQLIYVRLLRHNLLFNAAVAASEGLDGAWTVLKSGLDNTLELTPFGGEGNNEGTWAFVNPVFDPRINLWIGGDRDLPQLNYLDNDSAIQDGEECEQTLYTPFVAIETGSIDQLEIENIPGQQPGQVRAFISMTYDGVTWGREWSLDYSRGLGDYHTRFIARRLGYVRDWVGFRVRIVSTSKLAFTNLVLTYG